VIGPSGCLHDNACRRVASTDQRVIAEQAPPDAFFANPRNERTQIFLGQMLSH
jgi:general L-amino acid transport system ATP-binding protein